MAKEGVPGSPFTASDLEEINAKLKQLDEADELMRRASSAGIDVSAQINQSKETRQQLLRFKQAFFPGR